MKTVNTAKITIIVFALLGSLSALSCEGPTGSDGPAGPQGEPGPQGPKGDEGTANVIFSDWMDIVWNTADSPTNRAMYIEEPRVLGDFMDNGTLIIYLKQSNPSLGVVVLSLPYLQGTSYFYSVIADLPADDIAGILVIVRSTDGSTVTDAEGVQLRYVLVPGGIPAKMPPDFWKDYEAVSSYYGIPD